MPYGPAGLTTRSPAQSAQRCHGLAHQPLWGIGGWVAVLDDQDTARAHARATFPALQRALQLVTDIGSWQAGLS
jgi:hypothetical protein